jgi:hypothetical protein
MNVVNSMPSVDFERAVAELCVKLPVSVGSSGLACELSALAQDLSFRDVLTRGGWYRLGGVIDAFGNHLTDDLSRWGETELSRAGDDFQALCDRYADSGLVATRLIGRTHYLVAQSGTLAPDFVQVEIEELQEVVSHPLFDETEPSSLEELFEPERGRGVGRCENPPIGQPFYRFRRFVDVGGLLQRMAGLKPEPQALHRFFDAWQSSSAGHATLFCNHWIIAVREYLDRFRQSIPQAMPVAALNGPPPSFSAAYGAKGLALADALQRFDRRAGYPMAWFFHMLTTKSVPHAVGHAVIDDVISGFGYLPERDVKVLKDWLHRPFGF